MKRKQFPFEDHTLFFETGRMAKQADGAILVGEEGTVVLVTAVASKGAETELDYFPLFVEYREKIYAAFPQYAEQGVLDDGPQGLDQIYDGLYDLFMALGGIPDYVTQEFIPFQFF